MRTEHTLLEPPIKLNQHLREIRDVFAYLFEEIFAKVLKKQSCLRQNLLFAADAVAKSFCDEESVE